ncbi:DUF1192 family protein [Sneathiella sp.]|jgi:uncharacterized small protein (DUF1192 family)|uniref:DUF1192 family protein n=1 Tax=Sneathiella sp. TaxID=1964365 RepID=UPI0039E33276
MASDESKQILQSLQSDQLNEMSIEELKHYIEELHSEIEKAKIAIDSKTKAAASAHSIFNN